MAELVELRNTYRVHGLEFSKNAYRALPSNWRLPTTREWYHFFSALKKDEREDIRARYDFSAGLRTSTYIRTSHDEAPRIIGTSRHAKPGYLCEALDATSRALFGVKGIDARLTLFWMTNEVALIDIPAGKSVADLSVHFCRTGVKAALDAEGFRYGVRASSR